MRRTIAISLLITLLMSCSAGPDRRTATDAARAAVDRSGTTDVTYSPRFVTVDCDPARVPPPPAKVDCGELVVPENRSKPAGRQVRLPVAIVRASSTPRHPDPIIYFSGGPGYGGLQAARRWAALPLVTDRDIITFDQRGTGGAAPNLDCPEVDSAIFGMFEMAEDPKVEGVAVERAYLACRRRLIGEGIDLGSYDTVEVANDIADLRRALDIDEWNIFGISYGTTVAMEMLRAHPDGVRSAVIDSVYPPDVQLGAATFEDADRVFDVLVAGCAASEVCSHSHPDLRGEFRAAVDRLNAEPFSLDVDLSNSGGRQKVLHGRFTGTDLVAGLFNALYDTQLIPFIPFFIGQVAQGNVDLLGEVAQDGISFLVGPAEGQAASVECADRQRIVDQNQVRRQIDAHPDYGLIAAARPLPHICPEWSVPSTPAAFNRIAPTDVPTLVFGDEYDPVTPPDNSRRAAEALGPAATFVLFPGLGHGATGAAPCPLAIFRSFVTNPAEPLDTSCVASMPPPAFAG